tara:strand:- start:985 stop:1428 length:444 start_codon:yes stop_codon:yes gene_type:complete
MEILKLPSSINCLGCANLRRFPNGWNKGLCFMCFPRVIDKPNSDININDVLKMLFTRKGSFLRCDIRIINFLKKHMEVNHFPKLSKPIPKGYMINIGKNHYEDHNLVTGEVSKYYEGCIMIIEPSANDPDNDVPLAVLHLDRNFNIV